MDWKSVFIPLSSPSEVFLCGGYNGELILADLWKINLQTFQWTKLPTVMPEPAYFHCAAVTPVSTSHTHTFLDVRFSITSLSPPSPLPGWLYVCAWWSGEHVREQEDWVSVQGVASGAQPAGADLGEAAQGLPSPGSALLPAASQPGPHTHPHPAPQVDHHALTADVGTGQSKDSGEGQWIVDGTELTPFPATTEQRD